MRVLAFDVATVTGCAFGVAGEVPTTWEVDLGSGLAMSAKFSKAIRMTRHFCAKHAPDLVVIEAPVGGSKTSHLLVGLWACVSGEAANAKVPVIKASISTVRKHFVGTHLTRKHFPHLSKAKAELEIKNTVMHRCRALGWSVATDNCADAAAVWDWTCATHDPGHHTTTIGGLFGARATT